MPGLLYITLTALLACFDAFRVGSSQRVIPLSAPGARLFQDEGPAQAHFVQELIRTKRYSVPELVRVQPHLVHDMGRPEIHETSRSQDKMESDNSSQINPPPSAGQEVVRTRPAVEENRGVVDEMERMVHLVVPQDAEGYRGSPDSSDRDKELIGGPGAADASLEASGFFGTDMEDRDRGEEGGEDRERRGGEEEWERSKGEDRERGGGEARGEEEERGGGTDDQDLHVFDANHTTPDLDALIGYSPSFEPSVSSPAEVHDSGLQEHRAAPVLEVDPLERELWEAEGEEGGHSSGYGILHSSIITTSTTITTSTAAAAAAAGVAAGTSTPETDTGTDFGLLGSYTKVSAEETEDEETEREEEEVEETGLSQKGDFTQNPTAAEVGMAPSREPLQPSVEEEEEHQLKGAILPDRSEEMEEEEWRKMDGVTELHDVDEMEEARQVVCVEWSELVGRGYVVLNMTQNLNCEEFRMDQGVRLLKVMERVFARRMNSPEGSWLISLSKPTHQQHQLLMNVASERGVIATKDVLGMLGEIRKNLNKLGIQNYSSASSCPSRPSQTRSDYGKLFVVLVIIGSICMVIITSGVIYICWQRRLPDTKTTFRNDELHFVENGCHDNPMLDVTNDNQSEMQEKKPSTNGLAGGGGGTGGVTGAGRGGGGGGEESSRWQVFVNQAVTEEEEEEEQDTHL
ncbi:hypothetical protein PBY51_012680 [Eleginops maclovinus]|uniref:Podocalyxin-like protein 2 n=1 Tax=Eleginops maclovinus TaxID=56733 RepID=A0AAN7Y435_ELEMC|nr:hypothetical protein PBY51_012680 [Eleginops maclovinus]